MTQRRERKIKCSLVHPVTTGRSERDFSKASEIAKEFEEVGTVEPWMKLVVDALKRKRQAKRITLAGLARRAHVSIDTIKHLEAYEINSIGLVELLSIGAALGIKLTVHVAPIRPELPISNTEILREFDRLVRSRKCTSFIRNAADKDYKGVRWDLVGDEERNWLFVVASNPKKKTRFAMVSNEPGSWSIAGQDFGLDIETNQIAEKLAQKLMKQYQSELT